MNKFNVNKFNVGDFVRLKPESEIRRIIESSIEETIISNDVVLIRAFCGLVCKVENVVLQDVEDIQYFQYKLVVDDDWWWYAESWIESSLKEKLDKVLNE